MFTSNEELLLVHRDIPDIKHNKRYDIMLTPQFYIFKKEPLQVLYPFQAMKLAPAVLDELTGDGEYSYSAIKEDDEWLIIAYDMNKIETFLESKGLSKNNINKIYFAQQSKEHFKIPVKINEKNAMVTIDNTVVMLPQDIIGVADFTIITNDFRPSSSVSVSSSSKSLVSTKQAVIIFMLLLVLSAIYLLEGIRYKNELSLLEDRQDVAKDKYPSLKNKSSIVLNNLYNTISQISEKQRKIRDKLKDISRLVSKDSKIDILKIDTIGYEVEISADANKIKNLRKRAEKSKLKILKDNTKLKLKGVL